MPSDATKRRQQQKKEKKIALDKKRAAEKGKKLAAGATASESESTSSLASTDQEDREEDAREDESVKPTAGGATALPLEATVAKIKLSDRAVTGVLASHPQSRDLHVERLSITFHGVELLSDTKLELNCGQRYGLVGLNGSGKYSVLKRELG